MLKSYFKNYVLRISILCLGTIACTNIDENENFLTGEKRVDSLSMVLTINDAQNELERMMGEIDQANFLRSGTLPSTRRIINRYSVGKPINNIRTTTDEEKPYFHIFNFENQNGFAIVSGDKRTIPVLAVVNKGNLLPSDTIENPVFDLLLHNIEGYYRQTIENNDSTFVDNEGLLKSTSIDGITNSHLYTPPQGLCKTKWGQYYNSLLPQINNEYPPAGCVPVSVGQLMSVYAHPSSYNGYNFDWDIMTSDNYSQQQSTQINHLMKYLGEVPNLDVSYGLQGSGAKMQNIARTLKNFGYSNPGKLEGYNIDRVVEELKNGYPVILSGYDTKKVKKKKFIITWSTKTSYESGHAWLVHGLFERYIYRVKMIRKRRLRSKISTWYLQCNLGWNGWQDGYYLSNVFDTNQGPVYNEASSLRSETVEGKDGYYQYKLDMHTGVRK